MDAYREWAEVYDLLYQEAKDLDFYLRLARKYGDPILELGCGTGRILIPLAKAGFRVWGVDTSEGMLEVLKKKLKKEPKRIRENITIKKSDTRNFSLGEKFRLAIIPISTFQHLLTEKDREACVKSVYEHLEKGGIFVVDVFDFNPEHPQNTLVHHVTTKKGERTISKSSMTSFDHERKLSKVTFFIDTTGKDGRLRRTTVDFEMKWVFRDELKKLLEENGFRVIEIYGDYNFEPYKNQWKRMIFVAKKI